ncbi:hypothetical protein IPF86_00365 [Candidatus Nomurabacteria bacterium]|jgi:hypothetical protein|nr:MAG: hypothetical protein IPF86_00365 [Candidatus Nomurabacteria bacterium]
MVDQQVSHELKVKPYTELQTQFMILAEQKGIAFAENTLSFSSEECTIRYPLPRDIDDLESGPIFWANVLDILEDMQTGKKDLIPLSMLVISRVHKEYDALRHDDIVNKWSDLPIFLRKKELDTNIYIKQKKYDGEKENYIDIMFEVQLDSNVARRLDDRERVLRYFLNENHQGSVSSYDFQAYRLFCISLEM